jgi:hypothetical protein
LDDDLDDDISTQPTNIGTNCSDEEVRKEILACPPAIRKQLLSSCIKFKRVQLLDSLVPEIQSKIGPDSVANFLHGCSSDVIRAALKDEQVLRSPRLSWQFLVRHHSNIVVEQMQASMAGKKALELEPIWTMWDRRLARCM